MLHINGDGNGKRITAKDILAWLIPVLLSALTVGMYSTWSRVGDIQEAQAAQDNRITVIESSRFTTADGLEIWREVGDKVNRDELTIELAEIKELIRERNN